MNRTPVRLLTVALTALIGLPAAGRADQLDEKLLEQTRPLFKYMKERKEPVRTVGVLKFRAQRDGKPDLKSLDSFGFGPITTLMAERLEMVLIQGSGMRKGAVAVIRDASAVVAAQKKGLNYLDPDDRRRLFDLKYPLALGDDKASPDLFLTGEVRLDSRMGFAGLRTRATVVLQAFGKDDKLTEVGRFSVPMDRPLLADVGMGFKLRSPNLQTDDDADRRADEDARRRLPDLGSSNINKDPPRVDLLAFYNDDKVVFEKNAAGGKLDFTSRDPKKGDRVWFQIVNKTDERLAAVLFVNGQNTLYMETNEALKCTKWILNPKTTLTIEGFYKDKTDSGSGNGDQKLDPFSVLSDEESDKAFEPMKNEKLGTIELHVFVEGSKDRGLPEARGAAVVSKGLSDVKWKTFRAQARGDYAALCKLLDDRPVTRSRGLIAPGGDPEKGDNLKREDFQNPIEVELWNIRYYAPKK